MASITCASLRRRGAGGACPLAPADAVPADRLHALFPAAFADSAAGAPQLPLAPRPVLLARPCIDLPLGRVALQDGEPVAFALVAPRPESGRWRLGAMGAAPSARGSGAAQALLADLAGRERDAGMRELELECFAQNERAVRLYRRAAFARQPLEQRPMVASWDQGPPTLPID